MSDILTIEGVCKTFRRKSDTILALDHVSVAFPRESICGLLGNNGAGKTTLIKCVSGLLMPEEGRVMLDGEDVLFNAAVRKKKISVVLDGGRNLFLVYDAAGKSPLFSDVPLHISSRNEQERQFQVIWPCEQPVNDLFHVLDQCGLHVEEIDRSDGLAAAITVMTGQR